MGFFLFLKAAKTSRMTTEILKCAYNGNFHVIYMDIHRDSFNCRIHIVN